MSKHTPGPWGFYIYDSGPQDPWVSYVVVQRGTTGGCQIAAGDIEVAKADARLIAAAPDMLAALQGVIAWADARKTESVPFGPGGAAMRAARDAIAKATDKDT